MQACSPSGMASNEQTPLTSNNSGPSNPISHHRNICRACSPCLCNGACIAAFTITIAIIVVVAFALLVTNAAQSLPGIKRLTSKDADALVETHVIDVLQWSILIATFLLSVASFCMATTNGKKICHYSGIISALQTQHLGHNKDPSKTAEGSSIIPIQQQQAMLSLAIIVCNYADLYVMTNQYLRQYNHNIKQLNQHRAFIFPALRASANRMLDDLNKAFGLGLTREITNSHIPGAKEQFTLFSAHLLDATTIASSNHHHNENKVDYYNKWVKRDITEGNERLLVQIMSYLTNNNEYIGGEVAVNPVLNRIDGLLDVHLHLLEQQQH